MSKKYDTIVYIGRFQPVHNAHVDIIRRAATIAKKVVIIVGSAYQPRTYKNPFTADERARMLRYAATNSVNAEVHIEYNRDSLYNDQAWAVRVQELVHKHTGRNERIGIIGHDKDESTFYLKMFPQWSFEEVGLIEPLNATDIRDLYFREDSNMRYLHSVVPREVFLFLESFRGGDDYNQVIRERAFISAYKKQFEGLAYAPTFVTADAAVICSGHILMIKRKAEPGRGLWALPGGFLNAATDRSMEDCMIRELREETGIKVPAPVLRGSIQGNRVFDAIDRSARGRTITHAFKIVLPDGELPKVKGSDDAEKARWVPIAEVDSAECFEDHYDIVTWAVGG
jgi:bifunctional NMN adenylyltransferase/nudix hydrolase